jgi:5-methylcytosine-specific restriction endonuclease McrA
VDLEDVLGAALPGVVCRSATYRMMLLRDPCSYFCGGRSESLDHIIAKSRVPRGWHEGSRNLTGACRTCNQAKADLSLLAFLLLRPWASATSERMLT